MAAQRAAPEEMPARTPSRRPSARLGPPGPTRWRRWDEIADLFAGPADADWEQERQLLDHDLRDPWAER